MSQQAVPPTPNNYEVWFTYSLGASTDLKGAIDTLIGHGQTFDASVNRELFLTHIRSDAAATAIFQQLQAVMVRAREFLKTAICDNQTQIDSLRHVSSEIDVGKDPQLSIKCLVDELSKAMIRASTLEASFARTSQEMETIRATLQKLERHSNTDALTGLANRRALDEFLCTAQISAVKERDPLSILLVDVDHFKAFNDSFGHQMGDQILRLIAKVLRNCVRAGELPARYGGEEFMVVLPRATLRSSQELAERIRCTISECRLTRRSTGEFLSTMTVSIGAAQLRAGESLADLIQRCDRALYAAKRAGRNQTIADN
ncbi:GGDEF domain-containing protein [Bradyrhizobium erythrophlei]|uniref:GGDEF domain-containing protein n=1 Tax=Bradyrhizobium erythrophlei TaxID=1437360 RepID=UPI0035EE1336